MVAVGFSASLDIREQVTQYCAAVGGSYSLWSAVLLVGRETPILPQGSEVVASIPCPLPAED